MEGRRQIVEQSAAELTARQRLRLGVWLILQFIQTSLFNEKVGKSGEYAKQTGMFPVESRV